MARKIHEKKVQKYKKYKGVVLILGPNPLKRSIGANLRKTLKKELQKHIQNKYSNKIEVLFPEEMEGKPDPVDIETVKSLMLDNETKIIFGIWCKNAVGLIPEVHCIVEEKNTSLKAKIFVDENLWTSEAYIIHRNKLKMLNDVLNNVYPVNLKDFDYISKKAIEIFDGYYKWAIEHGGEWLGDV